VDVLPAAERMCDLSFGSTTLEASTGAVRQTIFGVAYAFCHPPSVIIM
jgi:hypothetical protein